MRFWAYSCQMCEVSTGDKTMSTRDNHRTGLGSLPRALLCSCQLVCMANSTHLVQQHKIDAKGVFTPAFFSSVESNPGAFTLLGTGSFGQV